MATEANETVLEEAKNLLVQGKRFMALEDYQSATDALEQSCQLFDAYYGVAKREGADAYLEYGLALVALANLEAGSNNDRILKKTGIEDGEDEEDDDEEEEDDDEEEEEDNDDKNEVQNKEETDAAAKEDKSNEVEMKDADVKSDEEVKLNGSSTNGHAKSDQAQTNGLNKDQHKDNAQPQASSSSADPQGEPTPGTSVGGDQDGEDVDNEEATTIEIAWEVLCLAKRLFMTDESLEGRLKLAETLQKIGEISIEWDNNDNAVDILQECLKIRTAILNPDDRLIALTYYNLGLAHSFKSETQEANENFQNAINVIEKRVASLTIDLEKAKETQDTVAIGSYQKEINELKELLPDMTMRLDDSKEDSIQSTDAIKRTREEMQLEDEEAKKVCLDKSKPVDDISHLVKRKAA